MSANTTRVDWPATAPENGLPLQEGNRVIESVVRGEPLHALLAFSGFHKQIRNQRLATRRASDRDLFEAERFILDEVLQLICDRVYAITRADGVVIALAEAAKAERPEMVCRAAAGSLAIERASHLAGASGFLHDCMETGRILRCDDCAIDERLKLDLARQLGARSTVVIPLRGRQQPLGMLQVFSKTPGAFTEDDVRSLDLFAELVLSAIKPEDQDRRVHWLSDVAGELLRTQAAAAEPVAIDPAPVEIADESALETGLATTLTAPIEPEQPEALAVPELATPALPHTNSAALIELLEPAPELADDLFEDQSFEFAETMFAEATLAEPTPDESRPSSSLSLPFLQRLSLAGSSHPGLSVVMGLVAIAALFSAGAWWGMQVHGKAAVTKAAANLLVPNVADLPSAVTTPPAPPANGQSPAVSDNLMNPAQFGSGAASLTAVAEDKLAALPKVMGVRHWSSSVGSTVVIDMEDQVPYEVHRLMSPERIYFDLHDTVLAPDLDGKTMDVGDPSLSRVRVAQPVAGVTRIVLDTKDGSNFSVSMESNPYRLVVELRDSEKTLAANKFALSQPNQSKAAPNPTEITLDMSPTPAKSAPVAALAAKAPDQSLSAKALPTNALPARTLPAKTLPTKTAKFRIVLDAGHGGWDLGTVGRQGLLEKDLVLDVTQRLGKLLQARMGSDVMFTRTDDTYLPLEQRADFANQAQADLFVSVHANYSSSTTARGVETYYSNLFSAPGAQEIERPDSGNTPKPMPVSISAGGLHEKIEDSRKLAASVQRALYSTLAANSPDIRDRGIKDSSFVVLTGTIMPSILTEISFVSSPEDEHNLQSAAYRQRIAEALYQGIARYQASAPHAKIAQLQKASAR